MMNYDEIIMSLTEIADQPTEDGMVDGVCQQTIRDAVDLINYQHEHIEAFLKDQEPLEPVRMHHTEHKQTDNYRCKFCGNDMYFEQRYCECCGKKVKWDE